MASAGSNAFFAEAHVGWTFLEGPGDLNIFRSRLNAAPQFAARRRRVVVCPIGTFTVATAEFRGRNMLRWSVGGGASVGVVAVDMSSVQVIPAFGVIVERIRERFSNGLTFRDSDTIGFADAGVGFVMTRRFSLRPSVRFPLNEPLDEQLSTVFQLTFTVSSGR